MYVTEVLTTNDPRKNWKEFDAAREREITGLIQRAVFEAVGREDILCGSTVI